MQRSLWLALFGVVLLAGCGMTSAELRRDSIRTGVNDAEASNNRCIDAVRAEPALASFAALYPEYESLAAQSQLNDPRRVTDDLRPVFTEASRRVRACRQTFQQAMDTAYPEAARVVALEAATSSRDWGELVAGEITIGEGVRRAAARYRVYEEQMAYVNNQVMSDLQARHATELHNRAVAAAALSAAAAGMAAAAQAQQAAIQRQQMINSINRPITTNCTRVGSSVSCSSF